MFEEFDCDGIGSLPALLAPSIQCSDLTSHYNSAATISRWHSRTVQSHSDQPTLQSTSIERSASYTREAAFHSKAAELFDIEGSSWKWLPAMAPITRSTAAAAAVHQSVGDRPVLTPATPEVLGLDFARFILAHHGARQDNRRMQRLRTGNPLGATVQPAAPATSAGSPAHKRKAAGAAAAAATQAAKRRKAAAVLPAVPAAPSTPEADHAPRPAAAAPASSSDLSVDSEDSAGGGSSVVIISGSAWPGWDASHPIVMSDDSGENSDAASGGGSPSSDTADSAQLAQRLPPPQPRLQPAHISISSSSEEETSDDEDSSVADEATVAPAHQQQVRLHRFALGQCQRGSALDNPWAVLHCQALHAVVSCITRDQINCVYIS